MILSLNHSNSPDPTIQMNSWLARISNYSTGNVVRSNGISSDELNITIMHAVSCIGSIVGSEFRNVRVTRVKKYSSNLWRKARNVGLRE